MRQAPSRIEYSEWTCRWTKGASGTEGESKDLVRRPEFRFCSGHFIGELLRDGARADRPRGDAGTPTPAPPGHVDEPRRRVPVLDPQPLDQLARLVEGLGKRLARPLAKRGRERVDLPDRRLVAHADATRKGLTRVWRLCDKSVSNGTTARVIGCRSSPTSPPAETICATSRSSLTSTTARRRSSMPCSGSPAPSAPTRTWPSACSTRWTSSARRASRSWPRTPPSRSARRR